MTVSTNSTSTETNLTRYAWLSILAAVVTIGLKLTAFWLTNSVGLLSDALESLVNLVAAIVALIALSIATRPSNEEFAFGYSKVEFFSSGFEGGMILLAAGSIVLSAIPRLIHPQPVEQVGLGLLVSVLASAINLAVALALKRAAARFGSITLEADSRHLMTDVLTTVGVLVGVVLVALTGMQRLDPIIALVVAANIIFTGINLLRRSARGLMDVALPQSDLLIINNILQSYEAQGIKFHEIRTRTAAARSFVMMHVLVPGAWSIQQGHTIAEQIEREIRAKLPQVSVITHVEPLEDEASWQDKLVA